MYGDDANHTDRFWHRRRHGLRFHDIIAVKGSRRGPSGVAWLRSYYVGYKDGCWKYAVIFVSSDGAFVNGRYFKVSGGIK